MRIATPTTEHPGPKALLLLAAAVTAAVALLRRRSGPFEAAPPDQPGPAGVEGPVHRTGRFARSEPTKQELYAEAQRLDIPGRSRMTKSELAEAVVMAAARR